MNKTAQLETVEQASRNTQDLLNICKATGGVLEIQIALEHELEQLERLYSVIDLIE